MENHQKSNKLEVIIVGAGIAGLACARILDRNRVPFILLEADKRLGGRIKTDHVDGYLLDHGFQVLQTAYPEARRVLDYEALQLRAFAPGVMIRVAGRFYPVTDPLRMPRHLLSGLRAPIGSLTDKLRFVWMARQIAQRNFNELFEASESATLTFLRRKGFSETIIERFFRPFFSGITLDPQIRASDRMFQYVFQMFAKGDVALPARGMAAIPEQLAATLSADCLQTGQKVASVSAHAVVLENGQRLAARHVVLATDAPATAGLLQVSDQAPSCPTACLYFSAKQAPIREKLLLLNGNGTGPVNSVSLPSLVAPQYAPAGRCLIAATVLEPFLQDRERLTSEVKTQLKRWFGHQVERWEHLRTYHIDHALPLQAPPLPNPLKSSKRKVNGIWIAGEYNYLASIQWSLYAGRKTGESILKELQSC